MHFTSSDCSTQYTEQNSGSNSISPSFVTLVEWIHGIIILYDGDSGDPDGSGRGLASSLL